MTVDKVPLTIFPTKYFGDPEVERNRIDLAVHIGSGVENLPNRQYAHRPRHRRPGTCFRRCLERCGVGGVLICYSVCPNYILATGNREGDGSSQAAISPSGRKSPETYAAGGLLRRQHELFEISGSVSPFMLVRVYPISMVRSGLQICLKCSHHLVYVYIAIRDSGE